MELQARHEYREELAALEARALDGLDLVVAALDRTVEAIQHQDIELAELVIADDDVIDGRYLEMHQQVLTLLATQAPVATDLRLISALLHVMKNIERIGDHAVDVGEQVAFVVTGLFREFEDASHPEEPAIEPQSSP